jgi:RNA polymerase sigma-70 factor (ECF subfamily)
VQCAEQQGSAAELSVAVQQFHRPLVRRLALVVGDTEEAEDLAQATYATAIESWASFDGRDLRAWLFTIGIRKAIDEVRRRGRIQRFWSGQRPVEFMPDSDVALWHALEELDRPHRAALLLHVIDGYTHAEIAAMFDVRVGTIASRISRAKQQMRTVLAEEEDNRG